MTSASFSATMKWMIKDLKEWYAFERSLLRSEGVDWQQNFRIVEALYVQASALGAFPLQDPLDGLDVDIKIARVMKSVSDTPQSHRQ